MGLWGSAFAVGFVIGPPLGTTLYASSPLLAAVVAASFSTLAFLVAFFTLREPPRSSRQHETGASLLRQFRKVVIAVIGLYLLLVLIWSQVTTMLALYTEDEFMWDVRNYGMYLGLVGLVAALIQGRFIGPLAKRFGRRVLVLAGFLLMGAGLLLLVTLPSSWLQVFSALPIAVGFGVLTPTLPAVLSSEVHPSRRGGALGVFQSVGTLGRVAAPLLAGGLYEAISHHAPFLVAAVLALATAIAVIPLLGWKYQGKP
jgi:DHA1 family tetracycline resistance protein-like MFS transporter